ncbi:annexin D5-like [Camellia sinensis]|uniref:annexin D5-like n=1 Tax=Camellia sinensis TaxID=4442 RepID=UPI001036C526|nr:annexin D5-like [Camellia sinensis]
MLLAYVAMPRYEGPQIDTVIVENDAKALYKAGEKRIGTNYKTFICIFSERSRAHLAAVNFAYHKMYGHSLEKAIKKKTSGKFTYALLTILQCVENPGKFFAKGLHKAMKGMGTDETSLTRITVTRAEIDMQYIKAEYHQKYGKSLNDAVTTGKRGCGGVFIATVMCFKVVVWNCEFWCFDTDMFMEGCFMLICKYSNSCAAIKISEGCRYSNCIVECDDDLENMLSMVGCSGSHVVNVVMGNKRIMEVDDDNSRRIDSVICESSLINDCDDFGGLLPSFYPEPE